MYTITMCKLFDLLYLRRFLFLHMLKLIGSFAFYTWVTLTHTSVLVGSGILLLPILKNCTD